MEVEAGQTCTSQMHSHGAFSGLDRVKSCLLPMIFLASLQQAWGVSPSTSLISERHPPQLPMLWAQSGPAFWTGFFIYHEINNHQWEASDSPKKIPSHENPETMCRTQGELTEMQPAMSPTTCQVSLMSQCLSLGLGNNFRYTVASPSQGSWHHWNRI